jgi:hypothetical protein
MLCVPAVYISEWCECFVYMVNGMSVMCSWWMVWLLCVHGEWYECYVYMLCTWWMVWMLCVHGEWYESYVFMVCTLGNDVNVMCTWWIVWMLCVPAVYIREW